jgi:Bacterial Ig-like domain
VVTAPAGWAPITDSQSPAGRLTSFWHLAAAGDPANWSFGLSQSTKAVAGITGYSGVNATAPIDVTATAVSGTGGSHTAPSVTTTGADRTVLSLASVEASAPFTEPGATTERVDVAGVAGAPTVSLGVFDAAQAVAGATGAKTATSAVAPSTTATITLMPPAPPPPPDTTPPTVTAVSPLNGAAGVALTVSPQVTFSERVSNVAAISVAPAAGGAAVAATVNLSGLVATITLAAAPAAGTQYRITVPTTVTDTAGNSLATAFTSLFTIAAAPPPPPPAPAFRAASSSSNGTGASAITLDRPVGTQPGDVMIAAVAPLSASGGTTTTAYSEGFETSLGVWHPWYGASTVAQGTVARTGLKSLQVNPSAGVGRAQASVPVVAGQQTATLYANGTGAVKIQMDFFSSASAYLGSAVAPATALAGGGAWTARSVTYTPPTGTTRVHFGVENASASAPWYVDDVTITAGAVAGGSTPTTITAPPGWTLVTGVISDGSRLMTFWRTAAAGDAASWSFGLSANVKAVATVASYSGANAAPIDASASAVNVVGSTHNTPPVTTAGPNRRVVSIVSLLASGAVTPPLGITERVDLAGSVTAPTVSIELFDYEAIAAGLSGLTPSNSSVPAASNAVTIALRP